MKTISTVLDGSSISIRPDNINKYARITWGIFQLTILTSSTCFVMLENLATRLVGMMMTTIIMAMIRKSATFSFVTAMTTRNGRFGIIRNWLSSSGVLFYDRRCNLLKHGLRICK